VENGKPKPCMKEHDAVRTRESGARDASLLEGAPREQRAGNMRKKVPECGILTEHRPELSDLQLEKPRSQRIAP